MSKRTEAIRKLNDDLRIRGTGGRTMVTAGVAALGHEAVKSITQAVAAFDGFDASNDPYGEHDFGQVRVQVEVVFFKVDYYDKAVCLHSPDPADASVTERVMTIMLSREY
jgi:hypothetical protein